MRLLVDGQILGCADLDRGIGEVFNNIFHYLISNDNCNEYCLVINDKRDGKSFKKDIETICYFAPPAQLSGSKQNDSYSEFINSIIKERKIDLYWNPNPLMLNVRMPFGIKGARTVATVYDLIPVIFPSLYLKRWQQEVVLEYKKRLSQLASDTDCLVFISHSTKNDFLSHFPDVKGELEVVYPAVDQTRFYPKTLGNQFAKTYRVLIIGGNDPRKNIEKAIESIAKIINRQKQILSSVQLRITGEFPPDVVSRYRELAFLLGIENNVYFTGHLPLSKLVDECRNATVLLQPSLYEGFSLPILMAFACGIPVVAGRNSAIPEVTDNLADYCSVEDVNDMAVKLEAVLSKKMTASMQEKLIDRANQFHWNKSGALYHDIFTKRSENSGAKLKIAWVSPWPPQKTGVALFSAEMAESFSKEVDLSIFAEAGKKNSSMRYSFPVNNLSTFAENFSSFDCAIYQIGNNVKFHKKIYELAWNYPGITVLHEVNIHPFLAEAFGGTSKSLYGQAWSESYGREGLPLFEKFQQNSTEERMLQFPLSQAVAKRSLATIVHSKWAKRQLNNCPNVFVFPLGAMNTPPTSVKKLDKIRKKYNLCQEKFILGTYGFINRFKRVSSVLQVTKILLEKGFPVKLVIGGEICNDQRELINMSSKLGISDHICFTGYLTSDDLNGLIEITDIVFNLRYPSLGESSATLMKALAQGKPCIVSNHNQFQEIPDSVCWKADPDENEIPQLVAFTQDLLRNPQVREQMSCNAFFFSQNHLSYNKISSYYLDVIQKVME
jgi:glycosyltransferase involved in cell wall biosynthesis